MGAVVNVILTHQTAEAIRRMLDYWAERVERNGVLVAYGGSPDEFDRITHENKIFISDPRLRTRDHQRELQSYTGIFRDVVSFLAARGWQPQYVHFAEYDHLPIAADLNALQVERLNAEGADLLGFHVQRIDGTSHPHYLYHLSNPEFSSHWARLTRRRDPEVVLSMFGTGSFWHAETFAAVTAEEERVPCYMELYLPTLAHHLGFRVRDFGEQNLFVRNLGDRASEIEACRAAGAWTLHPVKHLWG
jgi:hypothetical protein